MALFKPIDEPPQPLFRDAQSEASHIVTLSRAQPHDAVVVAGPRSLNTMVELCRRGFEHVTCACGAESAHADEAAAVVLIGGPVADALLTVLAHTAAALLAEEGAVVVRLAHIDQDRHLESALNDADLEIRSTVFDVSGGVLVNHRVVRRARLALAA
ncbi:hypothetical protein BH09PSE2_BH09PSE2_19090 [soil metagenome]